jgi:hypothetical protein
MTTTPSNIRQSRSRAKRIAKGGKDVRIMLTPKAAAKVARFILRGYNATQAVNRVLEGSHPSRHPLAVRDAQVIAEDSPRGL